VCRVRIHMSRSNKNRALTLVAVVLLSACNSESESKPKSSTSHSSMSSRTRTATAGARAASGDKASDGGASDSGAAADGGETVVGDAEATDGSPVEHKDGGAPDAGASPADGAAPDPGAVDRGPYFTSGPWKGYFWTSVHGAGTTLTSTNFTVPMFEKPVCIKGSVVATPDSSGNAILGMNINQAHSIGASPLTLVPSLAGLTVEVTNPGSAPLRVQVNALDGATNGKARWCASVSGAGGFIPWSQFNTACWDGSGNAYNREPISAAMLLVPGNTTAAIPYDFCLVRLTETAAPPPGTGAAGAAAAGSGGVTAGAGGAPAAGSGAAAGIGS
jgi:hypothetical protein